MGSPKDLASKLIELPPALEELPESDQLKLIRKLDRRQKDLASQLKVEQAARKHAEDELDLLDSFEDLVGATRGQVKGSPYALKKKGRGGNSTAVLCLTDWHCEENIDPATINGLNEYNLDISQRRLERAVSEGIRILDFAGGYAKIQDLVLWLGGDLINGYIHEELLETNFLGPTEAIVFAQEQVNRVLQSLLKETRFNITVVTNFGNHGRSTKDRRHSSAYKTSWEWLCFRNLSAFFKSEPRVQFKVENGYFNTLEIQGRLFAFHHGENVRYQGGVGGLTIPMNKAIAQWKQSIGAWYYINGHWHTYMPSWNFLSVGCLCGYSAYALACKCDYQPPTQALMLTDRTYGNILTMPVFAEKPSC